MVGSNEMFRHGIYIGSYIPKSNAVKPKKYVVDMFGGEYDLRAHLHLRTMDDFIQTKGFPDLAVIRYNNDTQKIIFFEIDDLRELYRFSGCVQIVCINISCNSIWSP